MFSWKGGRREVSLGPGLRSTFPIDPRSKLRENWNESEVWSGSENVLAADSVCVQEEQCLTPGVEAGGTQGSGALSALVDATS